MPDLNADCDLMLEKVKRALGDPAAPLPLLIAIDGRPAAGKSTIATWLSRRIKVPVIRTDEFIVRGREPLEWRKSDLARAMRIHFNHERPVIVEGVCVLGMLDNIDVDPDFLVWIERQDAERDPLELMDDYVSEFEPVSMADYVLKWQ